jgi:large subunit ribosomal protein L7/L12
MEKIEMDVAMEDVVKALGDMSVMEIISLTKELEQKWGVSAAPQTVQVQPQKQEEQKPTQDEFTVILASFPADKKMSLLKLVRELMALPLKEAKEFVESVPKTVKESVSKAEAEELKAKLTEAGGVAEIR